MIELQGVSKTYGSIQALQRTDLHFRSSETSVLIGPSGCGKSTLLRLLVGLVEPSSGRVLFDGEPLSPANRRAARRRVGYVIQSGGLFPHLSAAANVSLQARRLGWTKSRIRERLSALQDLVHLPPELMARFPKELSGGERQRVALMRALMIEPEVLLLDEPLGALDPLVRAELQSELMGIFQQLSAAVVIVTHDIAEAVHFGDRIILMHQGRVVQDGPWETLRDSPAAPFVSDFINALKPRPL